MQPPYGQPLPADDPAIRISRLPPVLPPLQTPGPFVLFDRHAASGRSQEVNVPNLSTVILEIFGSGDCDVQLLDAGPFGVPCPCADSNGAVMTVSGYTKRIVKNTLQRMAVQLTVRSGTWSVWATCIPY